MKKRNKIFQRITSLFLSTVMIVGMMGVPVYADIGKSLNDVAKNIGSSVGSETSSNTSSETDKSISDFFEEFLNEATKNLDVNNDTGDTGETGGDSKYEGWATNGDECWGLKFTLYFAEGITDESEITSSSDYRQIGKSVYVRMANTVNKEGKYYGGLNIFERLRPTPTGMTIFNELIRDEIYLYDRHEVSTLNDSESTKIAKMYSPNTSTTAGDLTEFFAGYNTTKDLREIDIDLLDFTNTAEIASLIIDASQLDHSRGMQPITDEMWKAGYYVDWEGQHRGVFKLYYEPFSDFYVNGTRYYMTLHDALAFNNENTDLRTPAGGTFVGFFWRYLARLANSVFLTKPDVSLLLPPTSALDTSSDATLKADVRNELNSGMWSMGLGIVTGGIYGLEPPTIIKTYVEITGVDSAGNLQFKKAGETIKEKIDFYLTEDGNITVFPVFEEVDNSGNSSIAVLNDVFTTPHDLAVTSQTEWVNTDLIDKTDKELTLTAADIAGYNFGIVTGNKLFVEKLEEYKSTGNTVDGAYSALVDFLTEVTNRGAGFASEEYRFFGFRTMGESVVNQVTSATEYTHHMSEAEGLAKMTSAELNELEATPEVSIVRAGILDPDSGEVVKMTEEYMNSLEAQFGTEIGLNTPANTVVLRYIIKPNPQQVNIVKIYQKDTSGNLVENEVIIEDPVPLDISNSTATIKDPITDIPDNAETPPEVVEWVTNSEYPIINIADGELPDKSDNGKEGTNDSPITDYPLEPLIHNLYVEWEVILPPAEVPVGNEDVPEWRLSKYIGSVAEKAGAFSEAGMKFSKLLDTTTHVTSTLNGGTYNYVLVNANGKKDTNKNTPANMSMVTIGKTNNSRIDGLYSDSLKNTYFHSKTFVANGDSDSISHFDNRAALDLDATLNMIKSKDNGKLVLANWITGNDVETLDGTTVNLSQYAINIGFKPDTTYSNGQTFTNIANLRLGMINADTYTHMWAVYYHPTCHHTKHIGCHRYCDCFLVPEIISPSSDKVDYTTANYDLNVVYDRYIQRDTKNNLTTYLADTDVKAQEVVESNGLTTIKYRLNETLGVYPEVGMLFDNDANTETIRWVIGDKYRQVKPVIWQTLEHKVYVVPNSNGSSVATDSRAITQARSLNEADKQVIYKGASVNTNFKLYRDDSEKNVALLTVKTYALDFNDINSTTFTYTNNTNMRSLKTQWDVENNKTYDSYAQHAKLLAYLNGSTSGVKNNQADSTEKLLVDSPTYNSIDYTGALKNQKTNSYKLINYKNNNNAMEKVTGTTMSNGTKSPTVTTKGEAVVFTHKLFIRGGSVIGVAIQSMNSSGNLVYGSPIAITSLKSQNESLYNAIVGMDLYNEDVSSTNPNTSAEGRAKTVLAAFEHKADNSKKLPTAVGGDGEAYATALDGARKKVDNNLSCPSYADVVKGDYWYSEDTTVLVIKEYVSNYEVPSISVSDKLSMTVNGLATPTDKAKYFSTMGKGYTYLKYNLDFKGSELYHNVPNFNAWFEYSSDKPNGNGFGQQDVDYLVPNVSITDTIRLN